MMLPESTVLELQGTLGHPELAGGPRTLQNCPQMLYHASEKRKASSLQEKKKSGGGVTKHEKDA